MTQTIELDKVDMESFEKRYKNTYRKTLENESLTIAILFDKNGQWTGHTWGKIAHIRKMI